MCLFAARTLVGLSIKDVYAYDVLSELGLRTHKEFGDRVVRGLVPLGEFTELETCCHSDCAYVLGAVGAGHQDDEYSKLTTEKDQELYLLTTALWSATFRRPSSVCNLHLRRLFGLSPRRIARLRAIICDLVLQESPMTHDDLVEARGGHGNGGSTPHNKTPDHFRAIIFRIYELHTRPDPVKPVLHVMAEGYLGGVASLVHRALEEAPETPDGKFKSPSNLRRLADQKCLACGCTRFSVHEAAHNACGLCCGFEVTHDRETKAAAQLRHAKEDAAAAAAEAAWAVEGTMGDYGDNGGAVEGGGGGGAAMAALMAADAAAKDELRAASDRLDAQSAKVQAAEEAGQEHIGLHNEVIRSF